MKRRWIQGLALASMMVAASAASAAPDLVNCRPKAYPASQLGVAPVGISYRRLKRYLPADPTCEETFKADPRDGPVGCAFTAADGVEYGLSERLLVNKTLQVTPSSKLPFAIAPGDDKEAVSRKLTAAGVAHEISVEDGEAFIGTGTCLKNLAGAYGVEITFGADGRIREYVERVLYP